MSSSIPRLVRWLLLIIISAAFSTTSGGANKAQAAGAPLLVEVGDFSGGDIFAYTAAGLKNMTTYGYNSVPVLSPDGKSIAYASEAKTFVDDMSSGHGRSGAPAINIWLMTVATGDAKRIADQPPDTRKAGDTTTVRPFVARSDPRWSPDSKFLAWMENAEGTNDREDDQNSHLILYKLSSNQGVEIYKQPIVAAGGPPPVEWTAQGISVIYAQNLSTSASTLRTLDTTGKIRSETPFDQYPTLKWLDGEPTPTVITENELVQLADNTRSKVLPPLEIYSVAAPDGLRFASDSGYFDANWSLIVPGAAPLALGKLTDYAISPDGSMAAYVTDDGHSLSVYDGAHVVKVDLGKVKMVRQIAADEITVNGLAWSPLGIRIKAGQ